MMTKNTKSPVYSICICNYNMADTIQLALESVLNQINDQYEVLVVDDGSNDNSMKVLESLQKKHNNLIVYPLNRDPKRKLGFTRNVSIEKAQGEYVLLHLDCDDVTAQHIQDFVTIFHHIEKYKSTDFLLSGKPIQMAKRSLLLEIGPYRNIHRGEDRDMLSRLAVKEQYLPLEHVSLKNKLPKSKLELIKRSIMYTFDHLCNDFRMETSLGNFIAYEWKYADRFSLKYRVLRLLIAFPAWIFAKYQGSLAKENTMEDPEEMVLYRNRNGGKYEKIMNDLGTTANWENLSSHAPQTFLRGY